MFKSLYGLLNTSINKVNIGTKERDKKWKHIQIIHLQYVHIKSLNI